MGNFDSRVHIRFEPFDSGQFEPSPLPLANKLFSIGLEHIKKGQCLEAIPVLRQAIMIDSNWEPPYINLAVAYRRIQKYKEAISSALEAVNINPHSITAHHILGEVYVAQGQFSTALKTFEQILEMDSGNRAALVNSAISHRNMNQFDQAILLYQKCLNLYGEKPHILHNLSIAYLSSGEIRESTKYEIKAIKTVPKEKRHYLFLASLLLELGKKRLAHRMVLKEVRCFRSDPDPFMFLLDLNIGEYLLNPQKIFLQNVKYDLQEYRDKSGKSFIMMLDIYLLIGTLRFLSLTKTTQRVAHKIGSFFYDYTFGSITEQNSKKKTFFPIYFCSALAGAVFVIALSKVMGKRVSNETALNSLVGYLGILVWNVIVFCAILIVLYMLLAIGIIPFYIILLFSRLKNRKIYLKSAID